MRRVIVTGANRGIGLELARQYAADGWQVTATCRDPSQPGGLSMLAGVTIHALSVDDPASIAAFANSLGDQPIDLLINNAGIIGPDTAAQSKHHIDPAGWIQTMQVNALAPILVAQAVRAHLTFGSKVVTVSSQLGSITETEAGSMYAYRMSKAAVNMGNRCLAMDWREDGIICLVVHPGWVQTDMGGPKAPVPPAESVAGLRRLIARTTIEDTGGFYAYDGRAIPW